MDNTLYSICELEGDKNLFPRDPIIIWNNLKLNFYSAMLTHSPHLGPAYDHLHGNSQAHPELEY